MDRCKDGRGHAGTLAQLPGYCPWGRRSHTSAQVPRLVRECVSRDLARAWSYNTSCQGDSVTLSPDPGEVRPAGWVSFTWSANVWRPPLLLRELQPAWLAWLRSHGRVQLRLATVRLYTSAVGNFSTPHRQMTKSTSLRAKLVSTPSSKPNSRSGLWPRDIGTAACAGEVAPSHPSNLSLCLSPAKARDMFLKNRFERFGSEPTCGPESTILQMLPRRGPQCTVRIVPYNSMARRPEEGVCLALVVLRSAGFRWTQIWAPYGASPQ